ncbi:MAG TPA: hypothetical protein VNL15_00500, partial [Dehalococcoidia bacterium]|nr:hypothetical protein [Dehalococcoidia bacterium]
MALRLTTLALLLPLTVFFILLSAPRINHFWQDNTIHFYLVSVASLLAAAISVGLIASARSIRETRILFLALSFCSLGIIFAVHGLSTKGFLYDHHSAALLRSPWLSVLAGSIFAGLSVVNLPTLNRWQNQNLSRVIFAGVSLLLVLYFALSLAFPDWLEGFPTTKSWFRHLLAAIAISLLVFAAWRYFQSYLFARLPGQLAIVAGLLFLAEAQLFMDVGKAYHFSWWLYHPLFLVAFLAVLLGWGLEISRARDVKAIAEALLMRDAISQLKRGQTSRLIELADQIEAHDLGTLHHVDRVAAYAYFIGKEMGLGPARLRTLTLAAQMHDIG